LFVQETGDAIILEKAVDHGVQEEKPMDCCFSGIHPPGAFRTG
jgi:hypothetical protein